MTFPLEKFYTRLWTYSRLFAGKAHCFSAVTQLNDCEYLFRSQVQYDKIHIAKHSNKAFLTKDFCDNRTVFQNLLDKRNS